MGWGRIGEGLGRGLGKGWGGIVFILQKPRLQKIPLTYSMPAATFLGAFNPSEIICVRGNTNTKIFEGGERGVKNNCVGIFLFFRSLATRTGPLSIARIPFQLIALGPVTVLSGFAQISKRGPFYRLGGPDFLLLGLFFAPASDIKKSEIRKSKNGASEMISVQAQLWHKSQKREAQKTLSWKDMR